jgi:hypothetical protein
MTIVAFRAARSSTQAVGSTTSFFASPNAVEHTGGGVYYLFFASPNAVATGIVEGIFKKYADYGE